MKRKYSQLSRQEKKLLLFSIGFIISILFLIVAYILKSYNQTWLSDGIEIITKAASIIGIVITIFTLVDNIDESKSHRICYYSNDTSFSNGIYSGVNNCDEAKDYFITRIIRSKDIDHLIEFFSEDAYNYAGVIVRYKFIDGKKSEEAFNAISLYMESNHKVVFVDTSEKSISHDLPGKYNIINSDLEKGGEILAEEMVKVIKKDTLVIAIDGPDTDLNLYARIKNREKIFQRNNVVIHALDKPSKLDKDSMFNFLSRTFDDLFVNQYGSTGSPRYSTDQFNSVVIYCGNDQNAYDLMSTLLKTKEGKYQSVIDRFNDICNNDFDNLYIFGYDGLRDRYGEDVGESSPKYKLEEFIDEFKYFSIDADPYNQGKIALHSLVFNLKNGFKKNNNTLEIGTSIFKSNRWDK